MYLHMLEQTERAKGFALRMLKATERITGIDNVYFFKGGFWMLVAQVAFIIAGIALSVAFTRLGDKALYGKYQFILGIIATLAITAIPGANPALMQAVSRKLEQTFFPLFKQKNLWSLLGSLGLFVTAGYFGILREDSYLGIAFAITAIFFPFLFWNSYLNSFFLGKADFARANSYVILERVTFTALVCAVLFFTSNIAIVILTYCLAIALTAIACFVHFKRTYSLKEGIDKQADRYGKHITVINIIPRALGQVDKLLIPAFLGIEALAIYSIAITIPDAIEGFMSQMHAVSFKKLVSLKRKQILPKLLRWWVIGFFVLMMAAIILLLPFVINLLYGSDYNSSMRLAQWYALMLPTIFMWKLNNNWLVAHKKTKKYFYFFDGYYLINAITIAGTLLLVPSLQNVIFARVGVSFLFAILSFVSLRI